MVGCRHPCSWNHVQLCLSCCPSLQMPPVVAFSVFLVVPIDATIKPYYAVFSLFSLCSREYTVKEWKILRPVQMGPNFCIPITGVCIPCAFFLEANAKAVVKVVVSPSAGFS